jgi:hypothetical protein
VATGLLAVIVVLNVWNSRLKLTPERLAAARELWAAAGPRDYDIEVQVEAGAPARYVVEVRNCKIVAAKVNGQPFEDPQRAYPWTVPGLFDIVLQEDLDNDHKPDCPPSYTQVEFDPTDGHPVRYLRTTERQRVQMVVQVRGR